MTQMDINFSRVFIGPIVAMFRLFMDCCYFQNDQILHQPIAINNNIYSIGAEMFFFLIV